MVNNNLLEQAQAIFKREFLDVDELPVGWSKSNLTSIANYLNGLAMQKYRPSDSEIGVPVLKIKELRQGFCDSDSELCSPSIKSDYDSNIDLTPCCKLFRVYYRLCRHNSSKFAKIIKKILSLIKM